MIRGRLRRLAPRLAAALGGIAAVAVLAPDPVLGHQLNATYTSRLPLAVYLTGAAIAVGLSFLFVLARDVRATPPAPTGPGHLPPAVIRVGLRVLGLVAVAWIVVQGILGNTSAGSVAPLFLWVYGWVGVALLSALLGPVWHFLDPFSTLHDLGAGLLRRLGVGAWSPAAYPARLGRWPATIGFVGFVWLELVDAGGGPSTLFVVARRVHGVHARDDGPVRPRHVALERRDVHGLVPPLGRLGRVRAVDEDGRVRRRAFASGLLERRLVRRGRGARGARRRLDPLRRALADAALLRPLRGARDARGDGAALRLAWPPGGRRARAHPGRRGRRDRGRAAADRGAATSSPTT